MYNEYKKGNETWMCDILHIPTGKMLENVRLYFRTENDGHNDFVSLFIDENKQEWYIFDELYSEYKEDSGKLDVFIPKETDWKNFGVNLKELIDWEITERWLEKDEDAEYDRQREMEL